MQYDFLFTGVIFGLLSLVGDVGIALSRKAKGKKIFSKPLTAKDTGIAIGFGVAGIIMGILLERAGDKSPALWSSPLAWALATCWGVIITADAIVYVRL